MTAPSNDIETFVSQNQPCGEVLELLQADEPGDGKGPVVDMADGWRRAPNGLWLEWVVERLNLPEAAAVRVAKARRLGRFLADRQLTEQALRAGEPLSPRARAFKAALAAYADDIRRIVKNPFESD